MSFVLFVLVIIAVAAIGVYLWLYGLMPIRCWFIGVIMCYLGHLSHMAFICYYAFYTTDATFADQMLTTVCGLVYLGIYAWWFASFAQQYNDQWKRSTVTSWGIRVMQSPLRWNTTTTTTEHAKEE